MSIQNIRDKSQSMLAKVIVGFIVVTFALFGVDAIVGYSSNKNTVASVNNVDIDEVELNRTMEILRRQMLSRMGENADPELIDPQWLRKSALDSLVERKLLIQDAQERGLYTPERQVDANILNTPAFQSEGVFNKVMYEAAVRNISLSPLDYKNQLAVDLLIQQNQTGITGSAFMLPSEVKAIAQLDRQLRNVAYLNIAAEGLVENVSIPESAVNEHYESNRKNYMTRELVQLEFLELKQSDYMADVTVDEAELKQLYQQEVESYEKREERNAAHILIQLEEGADPVAAKAKITELKSRLTAGDNFAQLARENSEDSGSAEQGGDLGFAERGAYAEAFDEALFSLETGQTSDIVETEFGFHIIKLLAVRKPEPPTYEEVSAKLEQDIKYQKAAELFVAASSDLENDSFTAGDLDEPAEKLGLKIQLTGFFGREGGEGIAANPKVARIAYSDEVLTLGNNSNMIALSDDHVVVVRVKEHKPSKVQPLDEVYAQIEQELKQSSAAEQTQKLGEQILVDLRDGKTTDQVSAEFGFEWVIVDKVGRNHTDLDAEINQELFRLPKPAVGEKSLGSVVKDNGDFVVLTLTKVYEGGVMEIHPQEIKMLGNILANQFGNVDFQNYLRDLKQQAEIEIY